MLTHRILIGWPLPGQAQAVSIYHRLTPSEARHLKKAKARQERRALRAEYRRLHPVLSGAVKVEHYHEPAWSYTPATSGATI